jgi:large repetitive protein
MVGMAASALAVVGAVGVATTASAPAAFAATFVPHATLVPELPARGYPIILKTPQVSTFQPRQVRAIDQAGRNIVSGGDFQQIELQNGTVIQQKFFAAWNIDTKQMVCQGKFTFDDEVLTIEPGPTPALVYVGGRFTKVIGADGVSRTRNRVALLNLDTCSVDKSFISIGANNKVDELAVTGNRLFVGGDFTTIGGAAVETLAELNATTGVVNTSFNFVTADELTSRVVGLGVNPAGTRLYVAGRFGTITGSGRSIVAPTAAIDITNAASPVLTAHSSTGYAALGRLQEASVAQDGSAIGLAYAPGSASDYTYLTSTAEQAVSYTWRHTMLDSTFGVVLANNAMYVTGHFCFPQGGPSASDVMSPKLGFDSCTGTFTTGGVWRSHIAALSLTDGTPLTWNPGQDSTVGGRALAVVTRGLLVGSDGERANGIRVGAATFFDFGPSVEDSIAPSDVSFTSPTPGAAINTPATVSGVATDNFRVASYRLAVRHSDGRWVQANGTLGTAYFQMTLAPKTDGSFSIDLPLPAGNYTARALAVDSAGLRSVNETTVAFSETGLEGVRPATTVAVSPSPVPTETPVAVTGTATDNVAVRSIVARVRDSAGRYIQDDLTLSTTLNDLPVAITSGALESPTAGWSVNLGSALMAGSYNVEITVTDASGNTQLATATFIVVASPPVISIASPAANVVFGQGATITATATDNNVSSVRLQLTNSVGELLQDDGWFGLAGNDLNATVAGLGATSATATFTTAVLPAGNYVATVTATDGVGNTSSVTQPFAVAAPAQAGPPVVLGVAAQTTPIGAQARLQIFATDGDGGAVIYAATELPGGLSVNAATGVITGSPTTPGTFAVVINVTDNEGEVTSTTFAWTVTAAVPPCVVRQVGANVVIDWEPIAGVTTVAVRRGGVWLADVAAATSDYTHVGGNLANVYTVRYRKNAVTTDLACIAV